MPPPEKLGSGKQAHHLLRHGINQIARDAGSRLKIRRQVRIARADVGGDVVKGDEGAAHRPASIGVESSGVRIPNLTGGHTAQAGAVERSSLRRTYLAKIARPHEVGGNCPGRRAQPRRAQAIIVNEEESLVLADGAANGDAIIVSAQRREWVAQLDWRTSCSHRGYRRGRNRTRCHEICSCPSA